MFWFCNCMSAFAPAERYVSEGKRIITDQMSFSFMASIGRCQLI